MRKVTGLQCILLVDDDETTNFIHARLIKKADLNVHLQVTNGGREALEYLTHSGKFAETSPQPQPGIIFLDLNMPGMNGWNFLEEYRKLPKDEPQKQIVVILTTSMNPDDQQHAKHIPEVAGFIHKPLLPENLNDIINRYFEN